MKGKIIEVSNGFNYGKFFVGRFDEEWNRQTVLTEPSLTGPEGPSKRPLLATLGWNGSELLVLDLQTQEGCVFYPHGLASADLHRRRVWVCPMAEPFLEWLYAQKIKDVAMLPDRVDLDPQATAHHSSMQGYRREGVQLRPPTVEFCKQQMVHWIANFYSDPLGVCPEETSLAQYRDTLHALATDLGMDYAAVVGEYVSEYERLRLEGMIVADNALAGED